MKTNALFSSKSFPAGGSASGGQYQHWRKHEEDGEDAEDGGGDTAGRPRAEEDLLQ